MEHSEPPVLIYSGGGGPPRAELFRSILQGSGIEAYVQTSGMSGMYPTNVGALGEFQIYVRASDAERAAEILNAAEGDVEDMELDEDFDENDQDVDVDVDPEGGDPRSP